MRPLSTLLAPLLFVACTWTPAAHISPQVASAAPATASEAQVGPAEGVLHFLLAAAVKDFRAHRPPYPARFRSVRLGHVTTKSGSNQYLLCGEFFPPAGGSHSEWTAFATIKTSGYDQWIGGQAASLCQRPSVRWDEKEDLSSELQRRLDSQP